MPITVPGAHAIASGGVNNYVMTAVDANSVQGEANLTFDGSTLKLNTDSDAANSSAASGWLSFGAGDDSRIYYDGTDSFWNLRGAGTGDLMIALAGSYPSPDPNAVHIWAGDSGSGAAAADSIFILEDSGDFSMSLFAPAGNSRTIFFSRPGADSDAYIRYYSSSDTPANTLSIAVGNQGDGFRFTDAGTPTITTQGPGTIATSSGDLTIGVATGASVLIGDNETLLWVEGGSSSIGIGAAPEASNKENMLKISGTLAATGGRTPRALYLNPTLTVPSGSQGHILAIGGTFTEAGSSTHGILSQITLGTPIVTSGSAAVTTTANLYIESAMVAGASNYALQIADHTLVYLDDATNHHTVSIGQATLTSTSAYTIDNSASLYIKDAPSEADGDLTVTNGTYALWVDAGVSRFDGAVNIQSTGVAILRLFSDSDANSADDAKIVFYNDAPMTNYTSGDATWAIGHDIDDGESFRISQGEQVDSDPKLTIDTNGTVYISDNANANMTTGLTINAGTATNWAFTLRGSNVDTNTGSAIPSATNVDDRDFFAISKLNGTEGGAAINVMNDNHANTRAFVIAVSGGQAEDDQTNSSGLGLMDIYLTQHDGSGGVADVTDGGNLLSVRCRTGSAVATRFIVTEDGELFATNATVAALSDSYDDAQLVRALDHAKAANGTKGMVKDKWDSFVKYNEQDLVDIGVLGETVENGGMLSVTALQRLHNGAIWQGYTRQQEMQEKIDTLESRLLAIEGA
jgi:hypothetical protein